MSSITDKQKGEHASYLIKQAPPGELSEVISDVRTLLNNDTILKEGCMGAIREYNEKMFTPCKVGRSASNSLVTALGADAGRYIDNKNKVTFSFDHIKRESADSEGHSLSGSQQHYFDIVDSALSPYMQDHYKNGNYSIYVKGSEDVTSVTVCIESHAFSPDNFWNGIITSEYSVDVKSHKVKGHVSAIIHYFEDGNVQMNSSKIVDGELRSFTDEKDLGSRFVEFIRKTETSYQEAVVDDIGHMMDTTFKALRRVLPITRSKIEWEKISSYQLAHELSK